MNEKPFENENNDQDVSFEIILEKRERSYAYGEPRHKSIPTDIGGSVSEDAVQQRINKIQSLDDDVTAIRKLVTEFENMSVDSVLDAHGRLTTDPYISISEGEVTSVNTDSIMEWMKTKIFEQARDVFSQYEGVEFNQLSIVMIDERTASAQYEIKQGPNTGTSAMVLTKGDDNQWRISVHCQHPVSG